MDEKREANRKRTLKAAKLVYGDFRYTLDGVVRNIGPDGAQIRCPNAAELPDEFYLYDVMESSLQKAEVVWRKDTDIGIRFEGTRINIHESADPRLARFRFM